MKVNFTQQEILLLTGTNFSMRHCWNKDDNGNQSSLTERQQLEEACWNGMLQMMLPEIHEKPCGNKKLYLWNIREANSYIEIELGEIPIDKENYTSIDPYTFLPTYLLS